MSAWATVGIVVLTAVLTWIGHAVLAGQQRRLDVAKALEQRKRDLYVKFLDFFFDILKKRHGTRAPKPEELTARLMDIAKDMAVYASDEVLGLFVRLREMELTEERDAEKTVKWFGQIVVQIRKDLGYSITRIKPEDVLALFITDIDKLYPERAQDKR